MSSWRSKPPCCAHRRASGAPRPASSCWSCDQLRFGSMSWISTPGEVRNKGFRWWRSMASTTGTAAAQSRWPALDWRRTGDPGPPSMKEGRRLTRRVRRKWPRRGLDGPGRPGLAGGLQRPPNRMGNGEGCQLFAGGQTQRTAPSGVEARQGREIRRRDAQHARPAPAEKGQITFIGPGRIKNTSQDGSVGVPKPGFTIAMLRPW